MERLTFSIEERGKDLGLSLTKHKLFDQPVIQKWGIFYQARDHQQAKTLVQMLEKVLLAFDYQAKPMAMFPVQGSNLEIWRQEIIQRVRADVQVVILLLPGRQGRSDLYPDLKRLLTQEIPIVSQAILTSTINYGKNLRVIVSKIVAQICAKIGGIPWVIDNMPYMDKRTMVCGLDVYHDAQDGQISCLGFVASYNKTCTKYWPSTHVMQTPGDEIAT